MAIVGTGVPAFIDSFDHYDTAHLNAKYDYNFDSGHAFGTIAVVGRNGTQGYHVPGGVSAQTGLGMIFSATQGQGVMGVAFRPNRIPSPGDNTGPLVLFSLVDGPLGKVLVDLRINFDGTLSMTQNGTGLAGGTSSNALTVGFYYYVEMRVVIAGAPSGVSANTCSVNVNGDEWLSLSAGARTLPDGVLTGGFNIMVLGRHGIGNGGLLNAFTATGDYDDLYFGVGGDTFLGDVMINPLYTTGNGASHDFTPLTGTNWGEVHEHPPDDDVSYVHSVTPAALDLYTFDQISGSPAIKGVQLNTWLRKDDASSYVVHLVMVSGMTTNETTVNFTPNVSYRNYFDMIDNDPNTLAPWTAAAVNALQAGPKLISVV